jgi:hypothetical protein
MYAPELYDLPALRFAADLRVGDTIWFDSRERAMARLLTQANGFKLRGPKGNRTKVAGLHERQVMRWIAEQRQAGWTWERIYLELSRRRERTRAGREWSVSRIRGAFAAEVAGKTRDPFPKRPRKRRPKPNLAAEWLHRFVRALR